MNNTIRTVLVSIVLAACSSSSTPTPSTPAPSATGPSRPAPPDPAPEPIPFEPIGAFISESRCREGEPRPELPNCHSRLVIEKDGTGSYTGDDTIEDMKWRRDGDRITVALANWSMDLDITGETLIDEYGRKWRRDPDPR